MSRSGAHDEEEEGPEPELGHVEGAKGEPHSEHPAHLPGLYLPDLSTRSGWDWHHIDREAERPSRPVGFRPR